MRLRVACMGRMEAGSEELWEWNEAQKSLVFTSIQHSSESSEDP